MIHSMVAHLDAVTSLAVDPNGIYLMSGSKLTSSCIAKRLCSNALCFICNTSVYLFIQVMTALFDYGT